MLIGMRSLVALAIVVAIAVYQTAIPDRAHGGEGETRMTMDGEALRVCAVVFKDFSEHLLKYSSQQGETARFLSDLGNYDVEVKSGRGSYEVIITPKQRRTFPIHGGGATYRVSPRDGIIRERVFSK